MNIQEKDDRFFGIFGISLCVGGLLLPFIVSGISGEEQAGGILVLSQVLALTFCIIGRKSKPGFVGLCITGFAVLALAILLFMKSGA